LRIYPVPIGSNKPVRLEFAAYTALNEVTSQQKLFSVIVLNVSGVIRNVKLGDYVRLISPRYGFTNGRLGTDAMCRVVGREWINQTAVDDDDLGEVEKMKVILEVLQ
jgi:hypothetical protein